MNALNYVGMSRASRKLRINKGNMQLELFGDTAESTEEGTSNTIPIADELLASVDTVEPIDVDYTNMSEITNHSGGAYGADTYWDVIGREFGVTDHKHYKDTSNKSLSRKLRDKNIQPTVLTKKQMDFARAEIKKLTGIQYKNDLRGNLQVRNYYQVANSDGIFAISQLADKNGKAIKNYSYPTIKGVTGGTNTAVQLAIKMNKPVYVWDTGRQDWFEWNGEHFTATDTPILTKNFAGIGSRNIESYDVKDKKTGKWGPRKEYLGDKVEKAATQAIRDVYEKTQANLSGETFTRSTKTTTTTTTTKAFKPNKVVVRKDWKDYKGKIGMQNLNVFTKYGVNTLRKWKAGTKLYGHFGNPFMGTFRKGKGKTNIDNYIRFGTIKEAVAAYTMWLNGNSKYFNEKTGKYFDQDQRDWILKQIDSGKLDGKTLLYYEPKSVKQLDGTTAKKGYYSHADALAAFIKKRRGGVKATTTTKGKKATTRKTTRKTTKETVKETVKKPDVVRGYTITQQGNLFIITKEGGFKMIVRSKQEALDTIAEKDLEDAKNDPCNTK